MIPSSRRFIVTSVVAAASTIGLFVVGWTVAPPGLAWIGSVVGLDRLYVAAPSDFLLVRLKLGAALALPPVVAGVAVVIHRARRQSDASTPATLLYLAVPLVAVALAMTLRVLWVRMAMRDLAVSGPGGIRPMVMLADLSPHAWGLMLGLASGVLLWLVVGARAAKR